MGMFDNLHYEGKEYQTKDTPQQSMDTYEIRGNELWWRKTEYEWAEEKESMFGGYLKEVSHEWVFCHKFDGLIRFYRTLGDDAWEEWNALFMDGKIIKLERNE